MSEDLVLRYKDNNSQRTPCVLVLDGSQSMDGQPIDQLNRGLKVLESELKEDVLARGRVRVRVIRVIPCQIPNPSPPLSPAHRGIGPVVAGDDPERRTGGAFSDYATNERSFMTLLSIAK